MATTSERRRLLAVACPWCHAAVGELCTVRSHGRTDAQGGRRHGRAAAVTTLDGECHDARWQAAGLGEAAVLSARVAELQPARPHMPAGAPAGAAVGGTATDVLERPW